MSISSDIINIKQPAVIMVTSIQGYSDWYQQLGPNANKISERYRKVLEQISDSFNGKILYFFQDRSLNSFSNVLEAVDGALELQWQFRQDPVIPISIGIHMGVFGFNEEELTGDDVNVASWMASEAVPGSILISERVRNEIENRPDIQTQFLRNCHLREIEYSFDVFAISNTGLVVPDRFHIKREFIFSDHKSTGTLLNFWNELKRRKVIRVVTVYAAVSYVMLELTSIVEEPLGLPDWTLKFLIILLSIGFVLVATLSWIYDITPEGIKITQSLRSTSFFQWSGDASHATTSLATTPTGSRFSLKLFTKRFLLPFLAFLLIVLTINYWDRLFGKTGGTGDAISTHVEKAKSLIQQHQDFEGAKKELDLALSADSSNASALNTYAVIHLAERDTTAAKRKLQLALKADSTLAMAWSNLATIGFKQDSLELALFYTIRAVEYDPGNKLAAYNMAYQSEHRGFLDQAVEWYKKAISMDSAFTDAYSALGALYTKINRPIDAILILQRSLRITPQSDQNYRIYKNLGEAHFRLQEYGKALGYLEKSINLQPDYPETEKCLARLHEATGNVNQSILHWQEYLRKETDTAKIREAENHLLSIQQ